jgi:hypothetical protein
VHRYAGKGCSCGLTGGPSLRAQIIEVGKFGFELIRKTIMSYNNLTAADTPATDIDRANLWVRQQSKAAGVNLVPYYKGWGWPVSAATEAALAKLPLWRVPPSPPLPPRPPPPRPPGKPPPPARPNPPVSYPPRCTDYSALVAGVGSAAMDEMSSMLLLWGNAIPLLASGSNNFYAAASRYGQGRVVVFGHEALMGIASGGMGLLNRNTVVWAAGLGKVGGTAKLCYHAVDDWALFGAASYKKLVGVSLAPGRGCFLEYGTQHQPAGFRSGCPGHGPREQIWPVTRAT